MDLDSLKLAFDIGFGATALVLWFKQTKINRAQQALDERQTKAQEDLTVMVKDHEGRIRALERKRPRVRR